MEHKSYFLKVVFFWGTYIPQLKVRGTRFQLVNSYENDPSTHRIWPDWATQYKSLFTYNPLIFPDITIIHSSLKKSGISTAPWITFTDAPRTSTQGTPSSALPMSNWAAETRLSATALCVMCSGLPYRSHEPRVSSTGMIPAVPSAIPVHPSPPQAVHSTATNPQPWHAILRSAANTTLFENRFVFHIRGIGMPRFTH